MRREAFEESQIAKSALPQPCPAKHSLVLESRRWIANRTTGERESAAPFHVIIELWLINTAVCGSLISCCSL